MEAQDKCSKCSLGKKSDSVVLGSGPSDAKVMVVGMCPGPQEIKEGKPFVGVSGKLLIESLIKLGIIKKRDEIYLTNVVKCYNPPGKSLSKVCIRICGGEYLKGELEEVKPKVVLVLGTAAAKYFSDKIIAGTHYWDNTLNSWIIFTHHPSRLLRTRDDNLFKEFEQAVLKIRSLLTARPNSQHPLIVTPFNSSEQAVNSKLLAIQSSDSPVAVDLETTGLKFREDRILSIGISSNEYSLGLPSSYLENRVVQNILNNKKIIGHNFKFDYKFLLRYGLTPHLFYDTMLAHFLINRTTSHGLREVALYYLGTCYNKGSLNFDSIEDLPEKELADYVAHDAFMTFKIFQLTKEQINTLSQTLYYEIVIPTSRWLAKAEYRGVTIDREYVKKLTTSLQYRIKGIISDVNNNSQVKEYLKKNQKDELNLNSPKQLSDFLYGFLKLPGKSTSEESLKKLNEVSPNLEVVKLLMEYRHLFKSLRTYCANLLKFSEVDGKVHCVYLQHRTPTGRLASQEPNLQNIPKSGELAEKIRKSFVASSKYKIVEVDYKQFEFRCLAHYSRDPYMIKLINGRKDIHTVIASLAYNKPSSKISPDERRLAKSIVFGLMYGRGERSIAVQFGIPLREAVHIKETFFRTFSYANQWMQAVQHFAKQNGYVLNAYGRKMTLADVYSKDKEKVAYSLRQAINFPIQSLAADTTNYAGSLLDYYFTQRKIDAFLIMNIHDSLVLEVGEEKVSEVLPIIKKVVEEDASLLVPFRVKLEVDIKVGDNLTFTNQQSELSI